MNIDKTLPINFKNELKLINEICNNTRKCEISFINTWIDNGSEILPLTDWKIDDINSVIGLSNEGNVCLLPINGGKCVSFACCSCWWSDVGIGVSGVVKLNVVDGDVEGEKEECDDEYCEPEMIGIGGDPGCFKNLEDDEIEERQGAERTRQRGGGELGAGDCDWGDGAGSKK